MKIIVSERYNSRFAVRVLYVLYKYDKLERLNDGKNCIIEKPENGEHGAIQDNMRVLNSVFIDFDYDVVIKEIFEKPTFKINGETKYCFRTWLYDDDSRMSPTFKTLEYFVNKYYKGVFEIREDNNNRCLYGPDEYEKILKGVDFINGKTGCGEQTAINEKCNVDDNNEKKEKYNIVRKSLKNIRKKNSEDVTIKVGEDYYTIRKGRLNEMKENIKDRGVLVRILKEEAVPIPEY